MNSIHSSVVQNHIYKISTLKQFLTFIDCLNQFSVSFFYRVTLKETKMYAERSNTDISRFPGSVSHNTKMKRNRVSSMHGTACRIEIRMYLSH